MCTLAGSGPIPQLRQRDVIQGLVIAKMNSLVKYLPGSKTKLQSGPRSYPVIRNDGSPIKSPEVIPGIRNTLRYG